MSKSIIYGEEAREKLKKGVNAIAEAVVTTLGPKGRNVTIERPYGAPITIHDGVSVAREVDVKDQFENLGTQMVKEASSKTNDVAGDGTTTAMLLAQSIVNEGLKNVTSGANPMILKKGIEQAVKFANLELNKLAIKLNDKKEIEQVATISAADEEIGKLVAEAIEKVGQDGSVTTEENNGLDLEIEYKEGMEFKSGYASAYFVTNGARMEAEIEDAYVLVADKIITSPNEIIPFLEGFVQFAKKLVVVANGIEGAALSILVTNKVRGILSTVAIKAPYSGERKKDFLMDVAALTGARVISDDEGANLESVKQEDLGKIKKVISGKSSTILVADQNEETKQRIEQLRVEIEKEKNSTLRERLENRLSQLTGGIAVIEVGAPTEAEMKEKVERVKDAIGAARAALDEGIVPGGGVALLRIAKALSDEIGRLKKAGDLRDEVILGMQIVEQSLYKPLWTIVNNAGEKADHIVEEVIEMGMSDPKIGFNVYNGEYQDMIEAGVIDPVKVTRNALSNAASVAIMVLTTEALVIEDKEKPVVQLRED